jgi:hypothetical protein
MVVRQEGSRPHRVRENQAMHCAASLRQKGDNPADLAVPNWQKMAFLSGSPVSHEITISQQVDMPFVTSL